ncbi:hypothetical protein EQM14_13895 [Caproiciproducens sp. NJN-50]|uniref:hypothetical protein n=1 Tax=Acutalibacteraceae TaxID=3082771 RepID=UPI000FFE197C|nr:MULTISPECIES: hypothetical protein [Acutalibacteraceae]QAT50770.1 hypothetical protein EQM14_13895 [Caproiciproducens sp. NJN-50]
MRKKICSRAGRIGCLLLAVIFAASGPTAAAASGESTKKDETVYVSLNASGGVLNTTVSDWLHSNSGAARVADRSNLKEIKNVKSSEQPVQTGESLTWSMAGSGGNGADIYYQGTTAAATPLKISVSYSLNGKSVTPEEIAGKSGKVKIRIDVKNTDARTVSVNGKSLVMYTPMTAVVAATLPSDTFRNVSVSKGKVISDGNNQFVTFLCMPGLSESLDLKNCGVDGFDTIDLPESLEITADAANFTLGSIAVAATPELPDEDDLGSEGSIDDLKDDLDKLGQMQDNINEADPGKDIRSLFTNPDRTAAARLIVDDVFDFYDLDTAALDLLPKYVTDQNISLYDRVTSDIDKADLKYVMDNKVIRGLNDRLTDQNVEKAKTLLGDYDDIETFQIGKLDRVIHVLDKYDKNYDHLNDAMKDAKHILNRLDESDVDTLAALSETDVRDSLANTLKSMQELSSSGLLSPSFQLKNNDVKALMEAILSNHPDLLEEALEGKLSAMEDKNGLIPVSDLLSMLQSSGLDSAAINTITANMTAAVMGDPSSNAVIPLTDVQSVLGPLLSSLPAEQQAAVIQQLAGMADESGNVGVQDLLSLAGSLGLSLDEGTTAELAEKVLLPEEEAGAQIQTLLQDGDIKDALLSGMLDSSTISGLTDSLNRLLSSSASLNSSLTKQLGSDYVSKLTGTMANMGHLKGYIDDLQDDLDDLDEDDQADLEDDFDDAKDLLLNKDDMDYLITWAKKLRSMKTDMDGNTENISILRDLINLNDDPKIKNFRATVPALQTDMDDSRPILDAVKAELDEPANSASLHKMPETSAVLTRMENDIRRNREIMNIFQLTTQPNTVSLFQDTFAKLDEFTEKGTTDNMLTLLDKKDAYTDLSDQYKIFTEAADGAETSVKFVYKTAEIKEPEKAETKAVQTSESSGSSGSGSGFWGRIRSAWNNAASTISRLF